MSSVQKKDRESFEHLLRRFNRQIQQSGILSLARKNIRYERPISRRKVREDAQRKDWRDSFKQRKVMSRIK